MKERWPVCLAVAGLLLPAGARGAWVQKYSQGGDDQSMATSIQSPDGRHVYACGMNLGVANPFTDPVHRILMSDDAGESWRDISGQAEELTGFMIIPEQIFFVDAGHGWLNLVDRIARTTDGGQGWTEVGMPANVGAMHFFDASTGAAVGAAGNAWTTSDGGASWTAATSAATVRLGHVFFLDRQRGFACGNDSHEDQNENPVADAGQVLATSDGGRSWQLLWETSGEFLGSISFLDGQTGWCSATDNTGAVYLLHTTDGGSSWSRQDVPTTDPEVMGNVTIIARVHFYDALRGRAVGTFDTGMSSSQGGQIYMIADYSTDDGGQSWSLHVDSPGTFPDLTPQGGVLDAVFWSDKLAWAAGTGLRIFKDAPPCQSDADCLEGFVCVDGACKPNISGPCQTDADCYEGYVCRDGVCQEAGPGPCTTDDDCPGEQVCQHGHCTDPAGCDEDAPVGQQGCPFGQICIFGQCIQDRSCATDEDCTATQRCYEGRCYPRDLPDYRCLDDTDCASTEHCVDTWCEPRQEDGGTPIDGSDAGGGADGSVFDGLAGCDQMPEGDRDDPATDGGGPGDGGQDGSGCGCRSRGGAGGVPAGLLMVLALWACGCAYRGRNGGRP